MANKRTIEVMVGLFMLLGIVALTFLALRVSGLTRVSAGSTYELTANFNDIGGLKVRGTVALAGVTVGRVTQIELNPQTYRAEVTLRINDEVLLPIDTAAKIRTRGLLGDNYIDLTVGTWDEMLQPGEEIEETHDAISIEGLIETFTGGKLLEE